jgi:EAL domain-containing protein (putative c-di-GMP-specific phosphodiesterase class I)
MPGSLDQGAESVRLSESESAAPAFDRSLPADLDFRAEFLDRQLQRLNLGPCSVGSRGLFSCDFLGYALSSAFQPIVGAGDRKPHSYEALLRPLAPSGTPVSPIEIFEESFRAGEERQLDRAARLLHVANFYAQTRPETRLFLNVHGRHIEKRDLSHGEFFATALAGQGLSADAITIEILESSIEDFDLLVSAIDGYKNFGFRVAIDDFGARHSNFDRVWRLKPDYVKIDRSLLVEATTNQRARVVLPKIIEIVHDLEALVVCEGIEDSLHERVAVDSGADFLQGYLYGRPNPVIYAFTFG